MKLRSEMSDSWSVTYCIGDFTSCGTWWHDDPKVYNYSKLYFPIEGEMEIKVGDKVYIGKPGELFLIPEGVEHSFRLTETNCLKKYWFHFKMLPNLLQSVYEKRAVPLFIKVDDVEKTVRAFTDIFYLAQHRESLSARIRLQSEILNMIASFFEVAEHEDGVNLRDSERDMAPLTFIARYMAENLDHTVSVEELATLANLHPNYLIRSFKQQFGVPPVRYLNNLRVKRIAALLCTTSLPFKEIMRQTGFSEPAYFSGFFKRETGYAPRALRAYYRENGALPPEFEQ